MRLLRYGLVVLLTIPASLCAQPVFTEVTDGDLLTDVRSWGASWVDADGDGDLDLFVSRFGPTGGNELFVNDGGTFTRLTSTPLTDGVGSIGHSWADVDNDGDLDVWTAGGGTSGFGNTGGPSLLYRNDGDLAFTVVESDPVGPTATNLGWSTAWGDVDDDGFVDAVIAHPEGFLQTDQENHLFRNEGDGTFSRVTDGPVVTGLDPYTIPSWSDYDLDGDLDLFIGSGPANGTLAPDNLYENDGGAFVRIETEPIATDPHDGQVMNWIDADSDGDLDLFVTNFNDTENAFYRNDAGAYVQVFDSPLAEDITGSSLANTWGDLDNDGDLDVIVTNGRTGPDDGQNNLYLNAGDGTVERVEGAEFVTFQESTSGATLGDYDGDGDLDLATTSPSASTPRLRLWRNDLDGVNGWLKLDLVGVASNRAAIGAAVRATATIGGETVTQFREVSAQNTFSGQNSLTIHFGLGDASSVTTLEITWPSGAVDTFEDVPADAYFELMEGGSLIAVANETPEPAAPETTSLAAAYPNPFSQSVTIRYTVAAGPVRLAVFDVLGRRVRTLIEHEQPSGVHTVWWDGTDAAGRSLSAGVYVYRLEASGEVLSRSLTLLP